MRKLVFIFSVLFLSAAFIVACKKSTSTSVADVVSKDVLLKVAALGFSSNNVIAADGGFIVEGDIFLSNEDLNKAKPETPRLLIANEEQYHTFNLVTGGARTINVSLSGRNITQLLEDGVIAACNRYNAENLNLTFNYIGRNGGGTINISVVNTGQYIASAGFPSNGNPYPTINYARTYTSGYSLGFVTTVLAHEMGHCIGFRHTDYMNRSYSCGTGGNEGQTTTGVGAVLIPGTPSGPDAASWMLACLGATTNRPFNANDKVALSYLY